jgi:hypothetical protein
MQIFFRPNNPARESRVVLELPEKCRALLTVWADETASRAPHQVSRDAIFA